MISVGVSTSASAISAAFVSIDSRISPRRDCFGSSSSGRAKASLSNWRNSSMGSIGKRLMVCIIISRCVVTRFCFESEVIAKGSNSSNPLSEVQPFDGSASMCRPALTIEARSESRRDMYSCLRSSKSLIRLLLSCVKGTCS